jgi:hypothetical protein
LALSHVAHEGRRWSQRFFLSLHLFATKHTVSHAINNNKRRPRDTDLLHAETFRNDEAADADVVGDAGFTGSLSFEASSSVRLRPVIDQGASQAQAGGGGVTFAEPRALSSQAADATPQQHSKRRGFERRLHLRARQKQRLGGMQAVEGN